MLPKFLLPETTVTQHGVGDVMDLGAEVPAEVRVTFGITRILEQQSIDVSVEGSADGVEWNKQPLLAFSQKFYCGTYQGIVGLSAHPGIRYMRAKWQVNRWGRGELAPRFDIYIFAQPVRAVVAAAGGAR